jgi:hypothetical protein
MGGSNLCLFLTTLVCTYCSNTTPIHGQPRGSPLQILTQRLALVVLAPGQFWFLELTCLGWSCELNTSRVSNRQGQKPFLLRPANKHYCIELVTP